MGLSRDAEFFDLQTGQPIIPEHQVLQAEFEEHINQAHEYVAQASYFRDRSRQLSCPILEEKAKEANKMAGDHFIKANYSLFESDECRLLVNDLEEIEAVFKENGLQDNGN